MDIAIDREKRLILLRWLKRGVINSVELDEISGVGLKTLEEIEEEMDRWAPVSFEEECARYKRLGLCKCRCEETDG